MNFYVTKKKKERHTTYNNQGCVETGASHVFRGVIRYSKNKINSLTGIKSEKRCQESKNIHKVR